MTLNEISNKIRELKELQALIDEATVESESIKDELKAHMEAEQTDTITADIYKVRYAIVKSSRFDTAAFKKDVPALYEQYTHETTTRRFTVA